MIEVTIPGRGTMQLKNLVLDLNGTIAIDGSLIEGVGERLQALTPLVDVYLVTADTYGSAHKLAGYPEVIVYRIERGGEGARKLSKINELGKESTVAIGNGCNDALMLGEAALGICVVGREGAAAEAIESADIVVTDITAALELLLHKDRLVATLRK